MSCKMLNKKKASYVEVGIHFDSWSELFQDKVKRLTSTSVTPLLT